MSSFEPHFQHRQSAHCESGVMASLLSHAGLPMSEPMAFGLASGLAFAYLPIVKLSGMPLIAYRMPPKHLIKTLSKRLGARLNSRTFGNPEQGRRELDALLDQGRLAGLRQFRCDEAKRHGDAGVVMRLEAIAIGLQLRPRERQPLRGRVRAEALADLPLQTSQNPQVPHIPMPEYLL